MEFAQFLVHMKSGTRCVLIAFFFLTSHFSAPLESKEVKTSFPVEASFLVVDFKYNALQGVKICEVQQAVLSKFRGDYGLYGNPGNISKNFCRFLFEHQGSNVWYLVDAMNDPVLEEEMKNYPWGRKTSSKALLKDEEFLKRALKPVDNPENIDNYHGYLYLRPKTYSKVKKKIPHLSGIVVFDVATYPYWKDKSKMDALFSKDVLLSQYKPKWKVYPKKYSNELAKKIIRDLDCEAFVIKPLGGFHGDGVLIVDQGELDNTLYTILKKTSKLKNNPDPSYNHWYRDDDKSFTVEEFVSGDPKSVPHLGGNVYDPTMRVGYVAYYHNDAIHIELLGMYWKIPLKSLEESGTLTEKHKSKPVYPNVMKVSDEEWQEIAPQLREALTLLYRQMLEAKN